MSTRYGHVVGLAPLLAAGCVGTGHASTAASGVSTSASAPTAPAKVVLVAIPPVRGRYPGDPPPRRASLPVRLYAAPGRVARVCDGVQRGIRPIVLCPTLLPRPTLPATPGRPLSQLETVRDPAGYELSYGSAWEPLSGAGWKSHLWRNRPCCFFHLTLTVYGRRAPDSYFPGPRAAGAGEAPDVAGRPGHPHPVGRRHVAQVLVPVGRLLDRIHRSQHVRRQQVGVGRVPRPGGERPDRPAVARPRRADLHGESGTVPASRGQSPLTAPIARPGARTGRRSASARGSGGSAGAGRSTAARPGASAGGRGWRRRPT